MLFHVKGEPSPSKIHSYRPETNDFVRMKSGCEGKRLEKIAGLELPEFFSGFNFFLYAFQKIPIFFIFFSLQKH